MISTIKKTTQEQLIDQYFAAQRVKNIPLALNNELMESFGCKGAAPLPIRDFRRKRWQIWHEDASAWLCIEMGGSPYRAALASTTIHNGDRHKMVMIVGSPELDTALVILSSHMEETNAQ